MPDWSIKITLIPSPSTPSEGPTTGFVPSPQQVLVDDLISWNNQTNGEHQPWPLDSNGKPAATGWGVNPVPKDASSNPAYNVASSPTGIVKYGCKLHLDSEGKAIEVGELEVLTQPPAL
ncbi:MAG TPA: hypothetical protein VNA69_22325 [Thermoanaerobaculia bacterium]|nr:hypothetical protein [Thermoanaerobaculia bacterium]